MRKGLQALEVAVWIALLQGKKAVVAGDDAQLPPTILSKEAAKAGQPPSPPPLPQASEGHGRFVEGWKGA